MSLKIFLFKFVVIMAILPLTGLSQLSPRIANYKIEADLDTDAKKLNGKAILTWKNTGTQPVDHLLFHLYYNAFRNSNSTFIKERGVPGFIKDSLEDDCGWGWTEVTEVSDQFGNDLTSGISFLHPDDDNTEDKTVMQLDLMRSVDPGTTITIMYDWTSKIPKTMPRTGYNMDYYFFAQWFPKVGVYEPAGMRYAKEDQWNCHQYHSSGEYYSDFGVYEVSMTVPKEYVIASSGKQVGMDKIGDRKTWHYKVDDVIDFTWSASPHYVITEDVYNDTEIKLYSYPDKQHFSERYLPTLKYCMQYLEGIMGPYPYPTLSVVDPPIHGLFTGGMEYPTLITSLSFNIFPKGFRTVETLVVHEYIHQYFMQMIATHEAEEPWMDEGFTTYFEGRILDDYLGAKNSFIDLPGLNIGNKEWNRGEYFDSRNPSIASNARKSWEYDHGGYGLISYNKTALWLQTLEGLIGKEVIDEIFRTYFQRWKFRHPARKDFIDIVNEIVIERLPSQYPKGMDWYFEQVLFGTGVCDYAVASIENEQSGSERGFFTDLDLCEVSDSQSDATYTYTSTIILHRLGELKIPMEIVVENESGKQFSYEWDGQERSSEIKIESNEKIVSAYLDPNNKLPLDNNLINNSLSISTDNTTSRSLSLRITSWVQHGLEFFSFLI